MAAVTKKIMLIYGAWSLFWLVLAAYGALFTYHGEYGISSHLWLTITGLPLSLVSWFITPHGSFVGSFVAGVFGLVQWSAVAEVNARWDTWQKSKENKT